MNDERVFLKVKLKSLAAEAKIIRDHEKKVTDEWIRSELVNHRRNFLRADARNSLLAYSFLNGWEYWQIENKARSKPNFQKIYRMVRKYGNAHLLTQIEKEFKDWQKNALEYWRKENETKKECN